MSNENQDPVKVFSKDGEFCRIGKESDRDNDRPVQLTRPCACGCDHRDGSSAVGYITGGTKDAFFRVSIMNEEVFQAAAMVFKHFKMAVFKPMGGDDQP